MIKLENLIKSVPLAIFAVLTPLTIGLAAWSLYFVPPAGSLTVVPINFFSPLKLQAQAAVVYDPVRNQIIFAKNADQVLPIASLTKLMTTLVAAETLPPQTEVSTSDGRRWHLSDLINFTLVTSFNDGANNLAAAAGAASGGSTSTFIAKMNATANQLNLNHTKFDNPSGLDLDSATPGAQSTATEVAKLMAYIVSHHPSLLADTVQAVLTVPSLSGPQLAINTNTAASSFPGLIASKTGFTDLAQGNLAITFDAGLNQPLVAVVLGSSETGRLRDARTLELAAIKYVAHDH